MGYGVIFANFAILKFNITMKIKAFALSIGIAAVLVSCGGKSGVTADDVTNPATASGNYDPETQPKMEFTETEFDFGVIKEGDKVSHAFKFKNTGKSQLIISDVATTCGCTVAEKPEEPIEPGGESEISAVFNSSGKAAPNLDETKIEKVITVYANTTPNVVKLKLKGIIKK